MDLIWQLITNGILEDIIIDIDGSALPTPRLEKNFWEAMTSKKFLILLIIQKAFELILVIHLMKKMLICLSTMETLAHSENQNWNIFFEFQPFNESYS